MSARVIAVRILEQILKHRCSLPQAFEQPPIAKAYANLSVSDKAFCYHLIMLSLRHYDKLTAFIEFLADKKPRYKRYDRVALVLLLGQVQILFLDTPLYAVISESQKLLNRPSDKAFHKFIQAILQKSHDKASEFGKRQKISVWQGSWQAEHGEEQAKNMWEAIYEIPPLDLRFKDAEACKRFADAVESRKIGKIIMSWDTSLRLTADVQVSELPFYTAGEWWVQDKAAGLAAEILAVCPGERVLDLCAAPGGKTAQLINSVGAETEVVAVEKSEQKIIILQENLKRLKMKCQIAHRDAIEYRNDTLFSAIMLDAPCSASGTLRHNPELPLIKNPEDIERLADTQWRMLTHAYENLLAQGGRMVYSVCSVQKQEGEEVMQRFKETCPSATIVPLEVNLPDSVPCFISENKYLRTSPADWHDKGRLDGFFIALIRKSSV